MLVLAGYDLITRRIIIRNPFQYYYELKNSTKNEIVERLTSSLNANRERSDLYEHILEHISTTDEIESLRIQKGDKLKNYLTELDIALRVLTTNNLVNSKYKVKYNNRKNVVEMTIMKLEIKAKGIEVLNEIKNIKDEDINLIVDKYVQECKAYVEKTDIITCTKDILVNNFKGILKDITHLSVITFEINFKNDIVIDHFTGKITINDFNKFKEFISKQNNSQLENTLKQILNEAIVRMTEMKIIINALETDSFENVYAFMNEESILNNMLYMALEEYIKLDVSYLKVAQSNSLNIKINRFIITDRGKLYFKSESLIKLKAQSKNANLLAKSLKEFIKNKISKDSNSNQVLKDLIASDYIH